MMIYFVLNDREGTVVTTSLRLANIPRTGESILVKKEAYNVLDVLHELDDPEISKVDPNQKHDIWIFVEKQNRRMKT